MKLVTFNVNGIRSIIKKSFIEDFYRINPDIMSINETKFSEDNHTIFPFEPQGYHIYWTNSKLRKGYSGVAVFTKVIPLSVRYGLEHGEYDDEGRVITLEFNTFFYVACYVPNSGDGLKRLNYRMEFEDKMLNYLLSLRKNKPVIYAGDLNVAHQEIDIYNPRGLDGLAGYTIEERSCLSRLLRYDFVDAFRHFYPQQVQYTWWSYMFSARLKNNGWRIDYFIVDKSIISKVKDCHILNDVYGSDHCPVELIIDD